jgi:hypothetical protein
MSTSFNLNLLPTDSSVSRISARDLLNIFPNTVSDDYKYIFFNHFVASIYFEDDKTTTDQNEIFEAHRKYR